MKVGPLQKIILNALVCNGGRFWPGCGILLKNFSKTRQVLDSLARKGLVVHEGNSKYRLTEQGYVLGDPDTEFREKLEKCIAEKKALSLPA